MIGYQGGSIGKWGRQVRVNDADPGFIVDQEGAGNIVEFRDGGTAVFTIEDGGNVTIAGDILPDADNTRDLGSAALSFNEVHVQTVVYATSVAGSWSPNADDTYDLGENSTPLEWKDLYIDGIAYIDTIYVEVAGRVNDDILLAFGTNDDGALLYETADADALALVLGLPHVDENANNVAVLALVDRDAVGTDLGAGGIDLSGITEPSLVIGNEASDAWVSLDAGDDAVAGSKGLYFKAAADEDVELINLSVTGTPRVFWDESENAFNINMGLYMSGDKPLKIIGNIDFAGGNYWVRTENSDNRTLRFGARDNGVGIVEVGKVTSAADPWMGMGLDSATVKATYGNLLGFYGTAPIAKPTGVAVTAAAIHAELVNLGLIAA